MLKSALAMLLIIYYCQSGSLAIGSTSRTGDFNLDGQINSFDLSKLAMDLFNHTTIPTEDLNNDGLVTQADLDHLVGSLVDINNGGIGGAHGTHFGDANLDGIVNQTDMNIVTGHWLQNVGWNNGNFNGSTDTVVNQTDLNTITNNWLASGPIGTGDFSPVPEPSTLALLTLGAVGLLASRKRSG